jgi:hypothetical protein
MSTVLTNEPETRRAAAARGAVAKQAPTRQRAPRPRTKRDSTTRQTLKRRSSSIHAYIGPNGSGKSLAMINDTIPTLDGIVWKCDNESHQHTAQGITTGHRRVLSTVALFDTKTGQPHPLYDRLTDWTQVLNAEHADILFDEVTGIAGSRESMGMPVVVQNILQQLRRRDVQLRWSAPNWARADSIIRGCTIAVTVCKGYMPDHKMVKRSETPPAWTPRRLFKWRTFSAIDFDEWTAAKGAADKKTASTVHALRAETVQWFWGPESRAFAAYDTYDAVTRVGEVLDGGRCAHCGGRRAVPQCKCDH